MDTKEGRCQGFCWIAGAIVAILAYLWMRPAVAILLAGLVAIVVGLLVAWALIRFICIGSQAATSDAATTSAATAQSDDAVAAPTAAPVATDADVAAAPVGGASGAMRGMTIPASDTEEGDAAQEGKSTSVTAAAATSSRAATMAGDAPAKAAPAKPVAKKPAAKAAAPKAATPKAAPKAGSTATAKKPATKAPAAKKVAPKAAAKAPAPKAAPKAAAPKAAAAASTGQAGTQPAALAAPRDGGAGDDLRKIKGIGPKLQELCNGLGIWHFDQIAAWSADEIAWMDSNLKGFRGRVSRDDWVAQAKILAAGGETAFSQRVDKGGVY